MASNWQNEASNSNLSYSTIFGLLYHIIASRNFYFLELKACCFGSRSGTHSCEGPCVLLITVQTLREKLISSFQTYQEQLSREENDWPNLCQVLNPGSIMWAQGVRSHRNLVASAKATWICRRDF